MPEIERIDRECALDLCAPGGDVAGAQTVRAECAERGDRERIEFECARGEAFGVGVAALPGRSLGERHVEGGRLWRHAFGRRERGAERRRVTGDPCDRADHRPRSERLGVERERAACSGLRGIVSFGFEVKRRDEQMRRSEPRVDGDRLARLAERVALAGELHHARHAKEGPRVLGPTAQDRLVALSGIGRDELLEEEIGRAQYRFVVGGIGAGARVEGAKCTTDGVRVAG